MEKARNGAIPSRTLLPIAIGALAEPLVLIHLACVVIGGDWGHKLFYVPGLAYDPVPENRKFTFACGCELRRDVQ